MNLFHFNCFGVHVLVHVSKEMFCCQQKQKYLLIFREKTRIHHLYTSLRDTGDMVLSNGKIQLIQI